VLVFRTELRAKNQWVNPVHDILQCVEAAASGDMSRTPKHWSNDDVGRLAQAVGRLISVLGRSENLVYHLAALVDGSGEAIISHTLEGTVLSWNKGAQQMYGYSAKEMKGRSIAVLSPEDEGAEMMHHLEQMASGQSIKPFEVRHQARNGRTVVALVRASAIFDSTRKVIGASFCAQELPQTLGQAGDGTLRAGRTFAEDRD
jgi:PAS domain S-box-containing protein